MRPGTTWQDDGWCGTSRRRCATWCSTQAGAVDVVIATGGTGLTSRDSTYEAIAGVLHKRIDGFGELFRALSFAEIGSAAMLSRACGRHDRTDGHLLAPRLRERRPPGHVPADRPRARPHRPRAAAMSGRSDRASGPGLSASGLARSNATLRAIRTPRTFAEASAACLAPRPFDGRPEAYRVEPEAGPSAQRSTPSALVDRPEAWSLKPEASLRPNAQRPAPSALGRSS